MKPPPPLASAVAIIGHGRSPEGKGWADRIDACGTVVRMWDCHWQNPEDYGERYDYGLFEIAGGLVETFLEHKQRDPEEGWVGSFLRKCRTHVPPRTEVIDQTPWNEIGKALGGIGATGRLQFTRGTIAACWAIERVEDGGEVVLVGFDNIYAGVTLELEEAFAPIYQKNPGTFPFRGYLGGVTKTGNHDFAVERPVMEYLAEQRGVTLSFAQAIW